MIHVAKKRLYVPALSILAIVVILLVLISISTYRNLDRQESMAMEFLHRQGLAILDAVEAGARAGLAMHMWQEDSIENLINEVGSNENIAYIYMVSSGLDLVMKQHRASAVHFKIEIAGFYIIIRCKEELDAAVLINWILVRSMDCLYILIFYPKDDVDGIIIIAYLSLHCREMFRSASHKA